MWQRKHTDEGYNSVTGCFIPMQCVLAAAHCLQQEENKHPGC
jgi:hypothetical protein